MGQSEAWVMAITAMAVYPNPEQFALTVAIVALVFARRQNVPSVSTWAGFGRTSRVAVGAGAAQMFNITMAVLLVLSLGLC